MHIYFIIPVFFIEFFNAIKEIDIFKGYRMVLFNNSREWKIRVQFMSGLGFH